MVADDEADDALADALNLARTPHGTVDNVMRVHSLRPNTMCGHVLLYRACLHDEGNTVPAWLQEVVGTYVSILNCCGYSEANHWANARHLINDDARSDRIKDALFSHNLQDEFSGRELAALYYTRKLTLHPAEMNGQDVSVLREAGWDDGEILELNQIICYFSYANRLINGLGVTTEGDVIGYYAEP